MNKYVLKNPVFTGIRVTGKPDQFYELKTLCGNHITITYEIAPGIGDYWCIKLDGIVVPDGDYILKSNSGYHICKQQIFNEYFTPAKG